MAKNNEMMIKELVESNTRLSKQISNLVVGIQKLAINIHNFMSHERLTLRESSENKELLEEKRRLAETNEELLNRLARLERKVKEMDLRKTLEKYPMRKEGFEL